MNVSGDYFLLYHGLLEVQSEPLSLSSDLNRETFLELASLFLSTHRKNFNLFSSLEYFKELSCKLLPAPLSTIESLYAFQSQLLTQLQTDVSKDDLLTLNRAFSLLHDANIISIQQYEQLHSLFNPEMLSPVYITESATEVMPAHNFLEQKELFIKEIEHLYTLSYSSQFTSDLDNTLAYIRQQIFSIGITGVMNAGKSTLLNALMGEEILGSSVVPETANLTIISYSTKSFAKVHYWDSKEWQKLSQSSHHLDSMQKFVDETINAFGDDLNNYITTPSIEIEIDIKDLSLYTSAAQSSYRCNLVKYVELGVPLDFLADGIEIVDTPGLDDPVIQREEITKEYMSQCDLMIHLMNVSQSATLKDIEFIIDALLYQNVSALLVLITRSDTVSQEQLNEVINYTKASIKSELKALNQGSKIAFVLEALTFLPISGYMALQHRTGKSHHAIEAGFSLEKTGILEVENYLFQVLFGSDSIKNQLIIQGIKTRIHKALSLEIKTLYYELSLLTKNEAELEDELSLFKEKKVQDEKHITALQSDIALYKEQILDYIKSLDSFISSALVKLQSIVKNRLMDDIKYSLENEKKHPPLVHIKNIVITALKDGIIDILRDYRYKCLQKMERITNHITQKYKNQLNILSLPDVDSSALFKETFSSNFLASNHEQLVVTLFDVLSRAKLKKIENTNSSVESLLKEHIGQLQSSITEKAHMLTQSLLNDFFQNFEKPLSELKEHLDQQERMITDHILNFKSSEAQKEQKALQLHQTLKKLESLSKGYK